MAGQEKITEQYQPDRSGSLSPNNVVNSPNVPLTRKDALLVLADITQGLGGLTLSKVIKLGESYYDHLIDPQVNDHPFEPLIKICHDSGLSLEQFGVIKNPFLWRSIPVYTIGDFKKYLPLQRLRVSSQGKRVKTPRTVSVLPLAADLRQLERNGWLAKKNNDAGFEYHPTRTGQARSRKVQGLFREHLGEIVGQNIWFVLNEKGTATYQGNTMVELPQWFEHLQEVTEMTSLNQTGNGQDYSHEFRGRLRLMNIVRNLASFLPNRS